MANLLIVDDDKDVAEPLKIFLEMEGHDVRYEADGFEAIKIISKNYPDLILLDVEMPLLTGPQMAYQLLILDCGKEEIPILLISGITDLTEVAKHVGTPYFLSKPYSLIELEVMLKKALLERIPPSPSPA
jgi:DNA-binding response OmpR family regulator